MCSFLSDMAHQPLGELVGIVWRNTGILQRPLEGVPQLGFLVSVKFVLTFEVLDLLRHFAEQLGGLLGESLVPNLVDRRHALKKKPSQGLAKCLCFASVKPTQYHVASRYFSRLWHY